MAAIGNSPTQQAFTPAIDYFSGNGSTTAFTLSRPVASVAQVQVTIDNVAQNPSSAYTVSSNTITFTSAPLSGTNNIYVYYTSPITQVIAPGQGTVNTTALGNITNIASGNSSLTLQTGSGNTTAVTVNTSQNVGIGNTSPSAKLHVSGGQSYVTGASGSGAYSRWYNNAQTTGDFQVGQGWDSASDNVAVLNNNANAAMILGTNGTERMRITSVGYVTTPYQVSAFAYITSNQTVSSPGAYKVSLNAAGYNIGGAFNTSTYRFTAPVPGRYLVLGVTEMAGPPTQNHTGITINGSTDSAKGLADQWNQCSASNAYSGGQNAIYKNVILNLSAGDYVELWAYNANNGTYLYASRTNMTITLLG
jgi:hypothetical protein